MLGHSPFMPGSFPVCVCVWCARKCEVKKLNQSVAQARALRTPISIAYFCNSMMEATFHFKLL